MIGHHAGHRSRQQNPQQQATHDPADHAAARFFRREVRGQWNQDLHRHRAKTRRQRNQHKHVRLIGERRAQQAGNRHQGGDDHQPAVFQQVTQRYEEEQAQGIADLGQRHDQAGHGVGQADVRCDQPNDWLRIVDVGDDRTAAEGEQQHHAWVIVAVPWGHLSRWGHNVFSLNRRECAQAKGLTATVEESLD